MNHKEQIPKPENSLEEFDMDATSSVDDFIKELEAKEKDLHITADIAGGRKHFENAVVYL